MRKSTLLKTVAINFIFAFCFAASAPLLAQTFTSLVSFNYNDGAYPTGFILGQDGNFYGTTDKGGGSGSSCNKSCGIIFELSADGKTLTTLHEFDGTDGNGPFGLLQDTSGVFYGTTTYGGAFNCTSDGSTGPCGTVYKFTGGTLTTLYNFCAQANCADGAIPSAPLIQGSDGNLYGTTSAGGTGSCSNQAGPACGTVFEITTGGTLTTLHSFTGADGAYPYGGLLQVGTNLIGTTSGGGTNGDGTVFEIPLGGGTLTPLYNFGGSDSAPYSGLIKVGGNFYGTTSSGSLANGPSCSPIGSNYGTIYEITPSGTLTTLHSFDNTDGALPFGSLIEGADGNLYGSTACGGSTGLNEGTIFQISTSGGTLNTLHTFSGTDGAFPFAGPVQAGNGTFYGTTVGGGTDSYGTIYSLALAQGGPAVTLSPTSLTFAKQVVGTTSAAKTVTVTNSGTATLDISIVTTSANFAVSKNTCGATLAPGKNCKVSVTFTPSEVGQVTGTLTFTDNAPNSPQTVALSGTGIAPVTLTPASATFGKQKVGTTSKPKTFTLTNNQSETLTGIATSITGDFAVASTTCKTTLAAKGKCTISVTFTPTQTGTRTGELTVSDSASNSPQTSTLTGTGD